VKAPPPYPRIPHLVAGRGTADDLVLAAPAVATLLGAPALVEEKVDGANVVLWMDDGRVESALRSGQGAMDRAGQLGPLRAWAAEHDGALRTVLGEDRALYAEWLLLTHSSAYDRLPAYLVALDLWRPATGFLPVAERDSACAGAGLTTPPHVWTGVAGTVDGVERLLGPAAWGAGPAEGLVVRSLADPALRAKMVPVGFRRLNDDEWRSGRPRNRLAEGVSWH
jgi:hypothetical protein